MNQVLITISRLIGSAAGIAVALGYTSAALAEALPGPFTPALIDQSALARLSADLAYPNSAQRFFEAGNAQFEAEIRRLSDEDEQQEPLLTVKPEVLKQFEETQ